MSEEFAITGWARLGGSIRDARRSRGMSQAELAKKADVARSWLARVEAGHRNAELEPLLRLLTSLELSLILRPAERERHESESAQDDARERPRPDGAGDRMRAESQGRRAAWGLAPARAGRATTDD